MSLINNNGGRTSAPDKTVKEKILHEQISSLRNLHRQSFQAFDKVVLTLRKLIDYKAQHLDKPRNEVEIKNAFLQNLSSLEQSYISLIDDFESDQELYNCTSIFRVTDKKYQNSVFRKTMKSYEQFKENLNKQIHQLQRDIQLLQNNGYHIYTSSVKPNNVPNVLKKSNLDKYLAGVACAQKIIQILKKSPPEKIIEEADWGTINTKRKSDECSKLLKNIYWKEQARQKMLIEQIEKSKNAFVKQNHKIKIAEEAIKKINIQKNHLKTTIKLCEDDCDITPNELAFYFRAMKEKIDEKYLLTPHLFKAPKGRSKSCSTVYVKGLPSKKGRNNEQMSQYTHILASDILQESIIV